jgi:hypothetical protein
MGGGGGGGGYGGGGALSPAESLKIFKTGVEEVRTAEAGSPRTRNVFISFHVADEPQVNLLRAQAKDADFGMEFRDYSLTSMTICMIGPETATREAVIWELEESFRQGKKVIGVRIYRDREDPVPAPLLEHKSAVEYWNRDAIRNHLDSG